MALLSLVHELCAEKVERVNDNFSFAGQHRVRLIGLKKNVHWKIPEGVEFDITDVDVSNQPKRRQGATKVPAANTQPNSG